MPMATLPPFVSGGRNTETSSRRSRPARGLREDKACEAQDAQDLVSARDNFFVAAVLWAAAQWPIVEVNDNNVFFNQKKRECYEAYSKVVDHRVETVSTVLGPAPSVLLADWVAARFAGKPFASQRWYVDASGQVNKTGSRDRKQGDAVSEGTPRCADLSFRTRFSAFRKISTLGHGKSVRLLGETNRTAAESRACRAEEGRRGVAPQG